jgi:2-oxoglutarate/2-oxoacid ferredoxin oxidoreductase subunit alpha
VPTPVTRLTGTGSRFGVIYYGSTAPAMDEALAALEESGTHVDAMRIRAFPFRDEVLDFVNSRDHVFVVEQNRDAQLRTLLVAEGMLPPEKLTPVLHYDGTPITARYIQREISQRLSAFTLPAVQAAIDAAIKKEITD